MEFSNSWPFRRSALSRLVNVHLLGKVHQLHWPHLLPPKCTRYPRSFTCGPGLYQGYGTSWLSFPGEPWARYRFLLVHQLLRWPQGAAWGSGCLQTDWSMGAWRIAQLMAMNILSLGLHNDSIPLPLSSCPTFQWWIQIRIFLRRSCYYLLCIFGILVDL